MRSDALHEKKVATDSASHETPCLNLTTPSTAGLFHSHLTPTTATVVSNALALSFFLNKKEIKGIGYFSAICATV